MWRVFHGANTSGDEAGGVGLTRPNGDEKPSHAAFRTMVSILDERLIAATRLPRATVWAYGLIAWTCHALCAVDRRRHCPINHRPDPDR
jgi:hypothetical protein